jgi:hypothetical protein
LEGTKALTLPWVWTTAGPLPVGSLAHDVDLLLRLVPDLVDLHPRQLLLDGGRQLVELRAVLLRHGGEQAVQRRLLDRRPLRGTRHLAHLVVGQLVAGVPPEERPQRGVSLGNSSPLLALAKASTAGCLFPIRGGFGPR